MQPWSGKGGKGGLRLGPWTRALGSGPMNLPDACWPKEEPLRLPLMPFRDVKKWSPTSSLTHTAQFTAFFLSLKP